MTNIGRMCQIPSCKKEAATLCYHCQQEICYTHFTKHSSLTMSDVYSLADKISTLTDNIVTFTMTKMYNNLFKQLKQWRDENMNRLETIYAQKQVELNAKIGHLDAALTLSKAEKQKTIEKIKKKIRKLIDIGEATFDQVNRLRKSVHQMEVDLDELRASSIRIEIRPANLDTCRIIYMDQVSQSQSNDSAMSFYDANMNDIIKHFDKAVNHIHSSKGQPKIVIQNNGQVSSTSKPNLLTILHPPPTPVLLRKLEPPYVSVPPNMPVEHRMPIQSFISLQPRMPVQDRVPLKAHRRVQYRMPVQPRMHVPHF
jgi:hypothetical protein